MIWSFLFAICVVGIIWTAKVIKEGDAEEGTAVLCGLSWGFLIIFGGIFLGNMCSGAGKYAELVSIKEKAITLSQRIEDIKASHYGYKKDGILVAGSIENIQQSKVLSTYIDKVAQWESCYNAKLEEAIANKQSFIMMLISDSLFISDRVYQLKRIERVE